MSKELAIVGIACRLPAIGDAQAFWTLVHQGRCVIRNTPTVAWRALRGEQHPDAWSPGGAFLDDAEQFDADFFNIAPAEAAAMDPQQRLALELAWTAAEDAGVRRSDIRQTRTGVFVGASAGDYYAHELAGAQGVSALMPTGGSASIVANRISYCLDLVGPSMVVDTACSASLVAVHLAAQAIASGECDQALAGGVNIMLSPAVTLGLSKARMLSPTGRSRPFDMTADGYVRGEGGGMVLLKRLADATAAGDHVYAILRGTAVNHNGCSNGLTAPRRAGQEALLRQACRDAGVDPGEMDYVEMHAVGTKLGDAIEWQALSDVFGVRPPDAQPCLAGSVKPNIGHLEQASGIVGLIKAALALWHCRVPTMTPPAQPVAVLSRGGLRLSLPPGQDQPPAHCRLMGVSALGFGGTNAHAILAHAGRGVTQPVETPQGQGRPVLLTARSEYSLRAWAGELAAACAGLTAADFHRFVHTLANRRERQPFRAAFFATNPGEAACILEALARHEQPAGVLRWHQQEAPGQVIPAAVATAGLAASLDRELARLAQAGTSSTNLRALPLPPRPWLHRSHWKRPDNTPDQPRLAPAELDPAARTGTEAGRHPRPPLPACFAPAMTYTQRLITATWEELLGYRDLGIDDPFQALGGDSIIAGQIATRLGGIFSISARLPIPHPETTVRELAREVEAALAAAVAALDEKDVEGLWNEWRGRVTAAATQSATLRQPG